MAPSERFRFRDKDSLLEKARTLGLELPYAADVDILFEPVPLSGKTAANRIAVLPMEGADAGPDGAPTELTLRRYRRFARGGSGLIEIEATAVVPEGRANLRQLMLTQRNLDAFKRLVEETRRAGQKSPVTGRAPLVFIQLTHSGRFARGERSRAPVIAGHNPSLDERLGIAADAPLVTDAELDELVEKHLTAARLASAAGFDGVDIKACHGYLVSELLASFTRTDSRYGGPLANRSRFLLEACRRTVREVPGMLVTSRLSAFDGIAYPYGFGVDHNDANRADLAEPKAVIEALRGARTPLLSISLGIPALNPHLGRPYNRGVQGASPVAEHPLEGMARLIRITAELQSAFPDLPLVGAGYSILREFWPMVAAGTIKQGKAALVGMGRGALAYPDAPLDLAAKGKLDPDAVCTACSRCSQMLQDGARVGCPIRDTEAYGNEYKSGRKMARREGLT
jgi:2,4-dienoyl-CoA reductase (NADPH2)